MNWAVRFYRQFRNILFAGLSLLLLYTLLRMLFWLYNRAFFQGLTGPEILHILYSGFKQDLVILVFLNYIPFIQICIADHFPSYKKYINLIAKIFFIVLNSIGLAFNVFDIGYFSYTLHRANIDLIFVAADSFRSYGSIIQSHWFLFISFIILVYLVVLIAGRLFRAYELPRMDTLTRLSNQLIFALVLAFMVKWPGKPILLPSSPLLTVSANRLPLAQNSLFTLAYSLVRNQRQIHPKNFYSKNSLDSLATSVYRLGPSGGMQKKNVVIFILESFSRGYLMPGHHMKAHTPFLDSLITKSIFFPNALANGFNSNQGIVSILGGLPAFLDEPFYYSLYANTPLRSIGNILRENGYNTNFFMGANKDHFGFEKFGRMAGIDSFYWRNDFNDENEYDGNWGIFDEPFLQFGARNLSGKHQPFLAVFFNISSHPPFTIPDTHKHDFIFPGQSPAQRAISYVDYSIRKFFERAKREPWFFQSLFVFCADHYLYPDDGSTQNGLSVSEIPIFIYDPSTILGQTDSSMIGQVDLSPTILHLLHYEGTVFGFGKNILDTLQKDHYVMNKPGQVYQIFSLDHILGYDLALDRTEYLYNYRSDPALSRNLKDSSTEALTKNRMENLLKANIQLFQQDLLQRSLD
jgi:phosphoglycerol transferase MdoB-like AlkP superfamily enzyme